jgi:hypothetical protein
MSNSSGSSGSFIGSILDFILRLLGASKPTPTPTPPQPVVPPDNTTEPVRIVTSRLLLVVYDPIMDQAGTKLSQLMNWNDPDTLANGFIQDILETSGGNARFQIAQRVELNEFPALTDGFRYDPKGYLNVVKGGQPAHQPGTVDYSAILTGLNVLPRIAQRDIDEVWLMGFPQAGFYESAMGGAGAFWCNSDPLAGTAGCERKFVVMGFSYERGPGEMVHSFGHRVESILAQVFNCQDFITWAYKPDRAPATVNPNLNPFERFLCFDQIAPGNAGLGTIHYAPNSVKDYDYNNPRKVMSTCDDWLNFPNFQNDVREVNADEWGNGDLHMLHKWWLKHLPKVAGRTGGVVNNWWQYIMDPNLINL